MLQKSCWWGGANGVAAIKRELGLPITAVAPRQWLEPGVLFTGLWAVLKGWLGEASSPPNSFCLRLHSFLGSPRPCEVCWLLWYAAQHLSQVKHIQIIKTKKPLLHLMGSNLAVIASKLNILHVLIVEWLFALIQKNYNNKINDGFTKSYIDQVFLLDFWLSCKMYFRTNWNFVNSHASIWFTEDIPGCIIMVSLFL